MYLHLGGETIVNTDEIMGIFDMDNATISYKTREFLADAEKNKKVIYVSSELPKSFVICMEEDDYRVYICQLASVTIIKRIEQYSGKGPGRILFE